jgi:hypothetical protein
VCAIHGSIRATIGYSAALTSHLSITDVAAAGGWQDTATLLACYQQPTNDALLTVMSEERKIRDTAILAASF